MRSSDNVLAFPVSSKFEKVQKPKTNNKETCFCSSKSQQDTEKSDYLAETSLLGNLPTNDKYFKRRLMLSTVLNGNPKFFGQNIESKEPKPNTKSGRLQLKVYNFLERPTGTKCFLYHVVVFMLVLVCLICSVLSTVKEQHYTSDETLLILESILVTVFSVEYAVRLWSAGCISKYMGIIGRLRFAKKPICLIDLCVVSASIVILLIGRQGNVFAASAIRGIRFLQILRMLHVDRQGGTWRLLGSVVYMHRQELITTLYIGFLALIFCSYFVYLAEQSLLDDLNFNESENFNNYADALWWGVVTVTTIGYGDHVPQTWLGKVIASGFSIFAISFFALPAGILGSGFALKVQQNQRQKQFNRQIPAAAKLIQASWRVYATSKATHCTGTWSLYELTSENSLSISDKTLVSNKTENSNQFKITKSVQEKSLRKPESIVCNLQPISSNQEVSSCLLPNSRMYSFNRKHYRPQDKMKTSYKNTVRAVMRLLYFVAKKRFQTVRQPYDVRDVVEMYTQGHANTTMRIKELQRRLDQTLGKPSSFVETEGGNLSPKDRQRHTVAGRLQLMELWMEKTDKKLNNIVQILEKMDKRQDCL